MVYEEFNIKSLPETFRVGVITPIEMLSILPQVNFDDYSKTQTLYTFCLEHIEVNINGKWTAVKEKTKSVYFPLGIENNIQALQEICEYMVSKVIAPAFIQSSK